METRDLTFWLHGLFELGNPEFLTARQVAELKNHLELVKQNNQSSNITPTYCSPTRTRVFYNEAVAESPGFFQTIPSTC